MTLEDAVQRGESLLVRLGKIVGAVGAIIAALTALWAATVGPGIDGFDRYMRSVIEEAVAPLKEDVAFLIANTPPPPVVEWNVAETKQVGDCTSESCVFRVVGVRTQFGENCGRPAKVTAELRLKRGGRPANLEFVPGWTPPTLDRGERDIFVPLAIPGHLPPGEYEWQVTITYERCNGPREPIPRVSPWWPLIISKG